jgi:hypothetical protein
MRGDQYSQPPSTSLDPLLWIQSYKTSYVHEEVDRTETFSPSVGVPWFVTVGLREVLI